MIKALIFAGAIALSAAATGHDADAAQRGGMPEWMAGAWERVDGASWSDEYWTGARGGMMIGTGRSGQGDKIQSFEHMRIEQGKEGLVFWALPGGLKPVAFTEVRRSALEITFENAAHDYPQRVHYWREGNQLKARISMIDGSKPVEYSWWVMGSK